MSDMRELIPDLDLISVERTSMISVIDPKRVDSMPIRKKRNRTNIGVEIIAGVSLALYMICLLYTSPSPRDA